MPLADHVSITITKDTVGIARAGFGVPLILSANAAWAERTRTYNDAPGVAVDFPVTSPEYLAAQAMFAQSPKPKKIMIGRGSKPTQKFQLNVSNVVANTHYILDVVGQGVTATTIDILTTSGDIVFGTIDATANTFVATAHGMSTGDGPFRVSAATTLPSPLTVDTDYWVIFVDANTIKLATTKANAIGLTAIDITTTGVGAQTLRRVQNDVICSQIVQALNAVVGKNFTAAQITGSGETDYIEATGNTAGAWFSIGVRSLTLLANKQTHTDPGVAADLTAILQESAAWYAVVTLYNSKAVMVATATWVEANDKVYIADSCESEICTVAVGSATDTATTLRASALSRTMVAYHPIPGSMMAAAWFGRCLPLEPGSETWNDKTLATVPVVSLTPTHRANIIAKNANSYQEVVSNTFKTFRGMCADGEFFDTIRGLDWFVDDASKSIYAVMAGADKIPYEDAGIARIEGALRASIKRAEARTIFAAGESDIQVPKASEVSDSDRQNRVLTGLKFSARLSGAIQEVDVTGVVTA